MAEFFLKEEGTWISSLREEYVRLGGARAPDFLQRVTTAFLEQFPYRNIRTIDHIAHNKSHS